MRDHLTISSSCLLEDFYNPLGVIVQSVHTFLWQDERADIISANRAVLEPDLEGLVVHGQALCLLLGLHAHHLLHVYFKRAFSDPAESIVRKMNQIQIVYQTYGCAAFIITYSLEYNQVKVERNSKQLSKLDSRSTYCQVLVGLGKKPKPRTSLV